MPSALLWAYSAENLFYNCNSGKSADFPELLFHRWGRRGTQHLQRRFLRKRGAVEGLPVCFQHAEPSQAHIRSPAPPKGELFAVTAQFPDKMQALRMRQKLPLSGELANPKDLTERARMLSLLPRGRLNSLWQSRTPSLLQSILMPCKSCFPSQPHL